MIIVNLNQKIHLLISVLIIITYGDMHALSLLNGILPLFIKHQFNQFVL